MGYRKVGLALAILGTLVLKAAEETAWPVEVPIKITVRADRVDRDPVTAEVKVGDTIRWTAEKTVGGDAVGAAKIRVSFLTPGRFDTGIVTIGEKMRPAPPAPAQVAKLRPNTFSYLIEVFDKDNNEIKALRETRNFIWVADRQDGEVKVRGIFACSTDAAAFCNDATHLRNAIRSPNTGRQFGMNWDGEPKVLPNPDKKEIIEEIKKIFQKENVDDDDLSVLYIGGHGSKNEANGDEANDTAIALRELIRDDDLGVNGEIGKELMKARGIKLLVFEACFSGGMLNGTADPPIPNSIVMSSNDSMNESNISSRGVFFSHRHTWFAGSLVTGLLDEANLGAKAAPPRGHAAADPRGIADAKGLSHLTIEKWFEFAEKEVARMAGSPKQTGHSPENPQLRDSFAPASRRANLRILSYAPNKLTSLSVHRHFDPDSPEQTGKACPACVDGSCRVEVAASSLTGSANRIGIVPPSNRDAGAQVGALMKFTFDGDLNLATSTVMITKLLDERGGAGELVKGTGGVDLLPIILSPRPGAKANAAIFESPSGEVPKVQLEIQTKGHDIYDFLLRVDRASIPAFPQLCAADGRLTTHLTTRATIDDGVNPPLEVSTTQPWRCLDLIGRDPKKPRSLRVP